MAIRDRHEAALQGIDPIADARLAAAELEEKRKREELGKAERAKAIRKQARKDAKVEELRQAAEAARKLQEALARAEASSSDEEEEPMGAGDVNDSDDEESRTVSRSGRPQRVAAQATNRRIRDARVNIDDDGSDFELEQSAKSSKASLRAERQAPAVPATVPAAVPAAVPATLPSPASAPAQAPAAPIQADGKKKKNKYSAWSLPHCVASDWITLDSQHTAGAIIGRAKALRQGETLSVKDVFSLPQTHGLGLPVVEMRVRELVT